MIRLSQYPNGHILLTCGRASHLMAPEDALHLAARLSRFARAQHTEREVVLSEQAR